MRDFNAENISFQEVAAYANGLEQAFESMSELLKQKIVIQHATQDPEPMHCAKCGLLAGYLIGKVTDSTCFDVYCIKCGQGKL